MHTRGYRHSRRRLRLEPYPCPETPQQVAKKRGVSHRFQSPAGFWDNLSQIWLTRNTLRELDRRNRRSSQPTSRQGQIAKPVTRAALAKWKEENFEVHQPGADFLDHCTPQCLRDIQKFARRGGPDLSELRGVCFLHMP